jgi:hypothetical protein
MSDKKWYCMGSNAQALPLRNYTVFILELREKIKENFKLIYQCPRARTTGELDCIIPTHKESNLK